MLAGKPSKILEPEYVHFGSFSLLAFLDSTILINPFQANFPFLYPLKTSENHWFYISGGTEREHWPEIG